MARPASPPPDTWLPVYAAVLRASVDAGGTITVPLAGASMRPTIPPGSRVTIARCAPRALRAGDVVVYEETDRLVCHRVLRWRHGADGDEVLTKGDGLRVPPVWVSAGAVVGRVTAVEARGRHRGLDRPAERLLGRVAAAVSWLTLLARPLARGLRAAGAGVRRA